MKIIDSKTKELSYGELMHTYYENNKKSLGFKDFQTWSLSIAASIQKVGMHCDMIGNTFFMAVRGPEGRENSAFIYMLSVDNVPNSVKNARNLVKSFVADGVSVIAIQYNNSQPKRVMTLLGQELGVPDNKVRVEVGKSASVAVFDMREV